MYEYTCTDKMNIIIFICSKLNKYNKKFDFKYYEYNL